MTVYAFLKLEESIYIVFKNYIHTYEHVYTYIYESRKGGLCGQSKSSKVNGEDQEKVIGGKINIAGFSHICRT